MGNRRRLSTCGFLFRAHAAVYVAFILYSLEITRLHVSNAFTTSQIRMTKLQSLLRVSSLVFAMKIRLLLGAVKQSTTWQCHVIMLVTMCGLRRHESRLLLPISTVICHQHYTARNRRGPVGAVAAIRMTGNVIVVIRRLMAANCVARGTSFRAPTKHRNCWLCVQRIWAPTAWNLRHQARLTVSH